jgi:RimJ/RimL family protein N-acetyltransferase/acyl carrier protein
LVVGWSSDGKIRVVTTYRTKLPTVGLAWPDFAEILRSSATHDTPVERTTRLNEDLGLDSLARIEVLIALEDRAMAPPGALAERARTAGELYDALAPYPPLAGDGTPDGRVSAARLGSAPVLPPPPTPAALSTPHVLFHLPGPDDMPFLYWLATDETTGWRWRYRGRVPTPDAFVEGLWSGVVTQFVVRRRGSNEPIGQVVLYDADHENGFAHLAAVFAPPVVRTGSPARSTIAFIRYVFDQWPLRKLYLEVPEFNLPLIGSAVGGILREEGRLRRHDFSGGRYWDKHLLAVYREDVDASPLVAWATGGAGG